jgi:hypothetical protein
MLRGTIRDHVTQERRPFLRSSPARRISPMNQQMPLCPTRSPRGQSRFSSSGRLRADRGRSAAAACYFSASLETISQICCIPI